MTDQRVASSGGPDRLEMRPQRQERDGAGRSAWTWLDQGLSGLAGAAVAILVAREVDTTTFGAFGVAFVGYCLALGISRVVVADALVVRHRTTSAQAWRRIVADASGTALMLGSAASALTVSAAVLLGGPAGQAAFALAVALPLLLVQDSWRYAFFAAGRPRAALANDAVLVAAQVAGVAVVLATGSTSPFLITLAWGVSAVPAVLVGCMQARVWPRPFQWSGWWRRHRDLAARLGMDYLAAMGAVNTALLVVAAVSGLPAVGALRASQVVFAPITLAFLIVTTALVPGMARRVLDNRPLRLPAFASTAVMTASCAGWAALLLLMPDETGEALLGETWPAMRDVLPACAAAMLGMALAHGATTSLRAVGRADMLGRLTLVQTPATVVLAGAGALLEGALGAAIGIAIAQAGATIHSWWYFHKATWALGPGRAQR